MTDQEVNDMSKNANAAAKAANQQATIEAGVSIDLQTGELTGKVEYHNKDNNMEIYADGSSEKIEAGVKAKF